MTAILGVSAFYHDSAAALVVDGRIVAAAQEERFTRQKHDASFPTQAIEYCLSAAGIAIGDLNHVGFYEKPLLKLERLLETHLSAAPLGYRSFLESMPQWVGPKLRLRKTIAGGLKGQYRGRIVFCEHHESHAASAFFPSPFDTAAILTMDGVGEWATSSLGVGRGNRIELTDELRFPHSLGLLYSACTSFAGFRVNGGEYKLMGLAPYGKPIYVDVIRNKLVEICEDGSLRLSMRYFDYCRGRTMTSRHFHQLFGRGPRHPEAPIETLDKDLAASVQAVTEEVVLKTAKHLHRATGMKSLCLAGGVALNSVANGRLLTEGPFEQVWIQPAPGDAGGALGVALLIWHQLLDRPRSVEAGDSQLGSLLGPDFLTSEILRTLDDRGAVYQAIDSPEERNRRVAGFLAEGKVVGWMQGRMEFGPRALGNRSILADPRRPEIQDRLNDTVKRREAFRPFAPAVLAEHAATYFDVPPLANCVYMQSVFPVRRDQAPTPRDPCQLPAVTHVDGSARVQTVEARHHPEFAGLLQAFKELTGCPVLLNTSFNVRGEPIVCTPTDALRCFMDTDLDVVVIGSVVLLKSEQSSGAHAPPSAVPQTMLQSAQNLGQWVTAAIKKTLTTVILTVAYYFALTPIALVMRLTRRDGLEHRNGPSPTSGHWQRRPPTAAAPQYFKTF